MSRGNTSGSSMRASRCSPFSISSNQCTTATGIGFENQREVELIDQISDSGRIGDGVGFGSQDSKSIHQELLGDLARFHSEGTIH